MLVMAKCTARSWDSIQGREYLPGFEYEIDTDSPLASLTTHPVAYKDGKPVKYQRSDEGKLEAFPTSKPPYVFEFDRNANPNDKPHDYSCKKPGCGAFFKTLSDLGTHTKTAHNDSPVVDNEPVVVVKDGRGKKKNKTFTCKECGDVLPNLYALGQHKKSHAKVEAEPVLA
jgi:hypothetical protein